MKMLHLAALVTDPEMSVETHIRAWNFDRSPFLSILGQLLPLKVD